MSHDNAIPVCNSADLVDGGQAVSFDLLESGQSVRAFAIRFEGQAHAYLNRCNHVPMEMDMQPDRFFDDSGRFLICATHGAEYQPDTGECAGGPCRGGLVRVPVSESNGVVYWHPTPRLTALDF